MSVNPCIIFYTSVKSALLRLSARDYSLFRAFGQALYIREEPCESMLYPLQHGLIFAVVGIPNW